MTNLTEKLDELQTQLATQHTAIINALSNIGTLIANQPASNLAPLLEVMEDIHLDTTSMDVKLLRLRDAVAPLSVDITPDRADIYTKLGALVWAQFGAANPIITFGSGTPTLTYQNQAQSRFDAVLGIDSNAPDSVLTYIAQIVAQLPNILTATIANKPTLALSPAQQCSTPLISQDVAVVPYSILQTFGILSSRDIIAPVWPTVLPTGIHYGSANTFGIISDSILESDYGWDNYQIYVESSAPYWNNGSIGSIRRFQTNKWLNVSDVTTNIQSLLILVDGENTMTAYLCPDGTWSTGGGGGGSWDSIVLSSQYTTASNNFSGNFIVWSANLIAGGSLTDGDTVSSTLPLWFSPTRRYSAIPSADCTAYFSNLPYSHTAGNAFFFETSNDFVALVAAVPFTVQLTPVQ